MTTGRPAGSPQAAARAGSRRPITVPVGTIGGSARGIRSARPAASKANADHTPVSRFSRPAAGLARPRPAAHFLIQGVPVPLRQIPRQPGSPLVGRCHGAPGQQIAPLVQRVQPRAMAGAAQRLHLSHTRPQLRGHSAQGLHQRRVDGVRT
ncbi:hypothetical protein G6F50_015430 [Rhizopus delemar]|uniref:Uncharacterized protein n=1 Tax=Rhizopus delemar TaxID=936053 RepID=A0A9P7C469_9FUNG|nr:hypothetical protein G6F50_015430 [Rhizopus delemar]